MVKTTVLFQRPQVQCSNPHSGSQLSVTAVTEDPTLSSDICRHHTGKWCTDIHADEIFLHIKYKFNIF